MSNDDRKNPEGYLDMTPYLAIRNAEKKERHERHDRDADFDKLIRAIFTICELSGFHIDNRLVVTDKITGKVHK